MSGRAGLVLFVTSSVGRSAKAITQARALADRFDCALEIVDVSADPARAAEERIVATPCLLRVSPSPPIKVIGDLDDLDDLSTLLELQPLGG